MQRNVNNRTIANSKHDNLPENKCLPRRWCTPQNTESRGRNSRLRWIEGFRDCAELARDLRRGKLVCVMDREADIFALFEEQRARPEAELLVRAKGRRKVAGGGSLLETLHTAPVCARAVVAIDRLIARPKSSKRAARPGRAKRSATLVLRARTVELAPTGRGTPGQAPDAPAGGACRGGARA